MPFFEDHGKKFSLYYRNHPFPSFDQCILHIHPHYEMVVITTNHEYEILTCGRKYTLNQPFISISAPYSMHHMQIKYGDCVERFIFYFDDIMLDEYPAEFQAFEPYKNLMFFWSPLPLNVLEELRPIFDMLAASYVTGDTITQRMLFLVVLNRILSLDKSSFTTVTSSNTGNINSIIRYMSDHFHENITAEDVAQQFFISRSKLNKDFKQYTGISFHGLIAEMKLSKAQYLLQEGNIDIKDIASQVGFESETYFFAFFKKMTGVTPLKYAKAQGYRLGEKAKSKPTSEQ